MRRHTPSPRRRALAVVLLIALVSLPPVAGCSLPTSPSMATTPREWRDRNAWGPEANAARAANALQPLYYPATLTAWEEFGREHIEDGDLLFRYGLSYSVVGRLTARLTAAVSDSPFTHDAIAHWEGDQLYVYDIVPAPEGARKMPFAFWALDNAPRSLVIKRLKPEYRCYIPGARAYIEDVYLQQVPFDNSLHLDDERLYCSEMIEKAFRSAGLALSDPVPIRCLPRYACYAFLRPVAERVAGVDANEPVFAVGNAHYGLFGSPRLELVYSELPKIREALRYGPRCAPVPFEDVNGNDAPEPDQSSVVSGQSSVGRNDLPATDH
jgi:hypothetical protein